MKWSEKMIARTLAMQVFNRKYLMVIPQCNWTGEECDLLCVTENLRIIDIEIKISKADLKRDEAKDKWYHRYDFRKDGPRTEVRRLREWPKHVWKHYYAMPFELWKPEMIEFIQPNSGIILLKDSHGAIMPIMKKRAIPNRRATTITPEDAIDIARLASLRMWGTYHELHNLRELTRTS